MKPFLTALLVLGTGTLVFGQANTNLSNLVSPTAVNQHLLPNTTNTRDVGSSSYAWRNVYLRGDLYLDGTRFVSNALGTTSFNAFVGSNAGLAITSGKNNSALGHYALNKTTTGYSNSVLGAYALYNNTTGYSNLAMGTRALYNNTIGRLNVAIGDSALYSNTVGSNNIAIGHYASFYSTYGSNIAIGNQALYYNSGEGQNNIAVGSNALYFNKSGSQNTALGLQAMENNITGFYNTALGNGALYHNTSGGYNTAVGRSALHNTRTAQSNTAIGNFAGRNFDNGYNNVFVGANAEVNGPGYYNVIAIGQGTIATAPSQVTIGNPATTSYRAYSFWSNISDGRYKKNLREDVPGLAFIIKLRPVTYSLDATGLDQFLNKERGNREQPSAEAQAVMQKALKAKEAVVQTGFVAQEVEKAAQELNYRFSGVQRPTSDKDVYGLSYSEFVVPLVKSVQELDSANKAKDKAITNLIEENIVFQRELADLRRKVLELKNGSTSTHTSNIAYLEQNTPNPVSGITTIRYSVPQTSTSAELTLTNAKGQLVKTISLGNRGKGQINLNTTMLAAGTYHYTLYVDGMQAASKRFVIRH